MAQEVPTPSVTEKQLQRGDDLAKKAFTATQKGDFTQAEASWTQLIEAFPTNPAVWSNRGNSRVSQNKIDAAIADFNQAIQLAPNAPDPY
ncbi:MAG: tetratricopeptide repeat protein, partial [Microcystaceae cyanobacterium]